MLNRRRSDRFAVSVPVLVKAGNGAESTLTANVSAHGVAVFSDLPLKPRQYVDLELKLPPDGEVVTVTAVVARITRRLEDRGGASHPGLAFDFYLFDARGRTAWRAYLDRLRAGPAPASDPAGPELPPEDEEVNATFIIKPRDVGRLWSFYRNELGLGRARIEAPVLKPPGTPVEILVVHPVTSDEWPLLGEVANSSEHGRGRGPMLEIALIDIGDEGRRSFRRFISSGEVTELPGTALLEPTQRPDLEAAMDTDHETQEQPTYGEVPPLVPAGDPGESNPTPFAPQVWMATDGGLRPREPLVSPPTRPSLDANVPPPPVLTGDLELPGPGQPPAVPLANFPVPLVSVSSPPPVSVTSAPPMTMESSDEDDILSEEEEIIEDEASDSDTDQAAETSTPAAGVASTRPFAAFFEEFSRASQIPKAQSRPPAPPPLPEASAAPEASPESSFDDGETSREQARIQARPGPEPKPSTRPAGIREAQSTAAHRSVSTAGVDPALDREIGLARARVVRSPGSVTACYQLGKLLLRRDSPDSLVEAMEQLRKAVELEPNHPGAHLAAAELAVKQGNFELAAEHLQRARRLGYRIDERLERQVAEGRRTT